MSLRGVPTVVQTLRVIRPEWAVVDDVAISLYKKIMIECTTLFGKKRMVEKDKLIHRTAVYGIIKYGDKILLVNTKSTGKWFLPGGRIEKNESKEKALEREVLEETGVPVSVDKKIYFKKTFFYYDPFDETYENDSYFFSCTPLTTDIEIENNPDKDDEVNKAQWVEIRSIRTKDLQYPLNELFPLLTNT